MLSQSPVSQIMDMPNQGLPVTIVTGFLGSGKTTLLNHILQNQKGLKIAVLVNEFGNIDIDSQLLISADQDMLQLSNGCICCSINEGLVETVYDILEREDKVDYLVVETSGVADPLPLALTFVGTELKQLTRLDSILTVVDAETFSPKFLNSEAALNQVAYGDIILLNKVDLIPPEQLEAAESHIQQVKDGARILHCSHGAVPLDMILDIGLSSTEQHDEWEQTLEELAKEKQAGSSNHLKNDGFDSLSFKSTRPFDIQRFEHFLREQLPDNIYRAKGLLWLQGETGRFIFQLSGKRYSLDRDQWPTEPLNQLVFIGRNLDKLTLMQQLNNCLGRQ
ncbi:cobalamin synthesis protein P47K [[Leptolyngbya] sp. PCC 7376]|nr:cobalamin synthesis protein P47K [[Leptolyngbya] sp. PCC 7376]